MLFDDRLSNKHAIEWIAVNRWQEGKLGTVRGFYSESLDALSGQSSRYNLPPVWLQLKIVSVETQFDSNFPQTDNAVGDCVCRFEGFTGLG